MMVSMARKLILLVEDDPDIAKNLKEVLELEGYEVVVAPNGQKALATLRSREATRPAVILLDLLMPVMTGWEFLEVQKADVEIKDIPVIALSAAGEKAQAALAQAFIKKPLEIDHLIHLIEVFSKGA